MTEDDFVQKIDMLDQLLNDSNVRLEPAKIWHLLAEIADRAPRDGEELPQPPAADCPESGEAGKEATSIPCGLCGGKGVFRGIDCPACRRPRSGLTRGMRIVNDGKSDLQQYGFGEIEFAHVTSQSAIDSAGIDRASPVAREA